MATKKTGKKKKASKKRKSSTKRSHKAAIAALVRQPLGTLVRKAANISTAIAVKHQKTALRKGTFFGPRKLSATELKRYAGKTARGNAVIEALIARNT